MIKTSASISVQFDNIFSPFRGADFEQGFAWVRESGFDGVEMILSDPNMVDRKKISRLLEQYELEASTISTGQALGLEGLSMTSPSAQVREITRKRLYDDIDFSEQMEKPNVTVGLIRGRGGELPEEVEYCYLLQEMQYIGEYADKKGITINFEPINRYEVKRLNRTESVAKLIEDLGNPSNVGILYDTFHSNIEDDRMLETIDQVFPKISHVHLADSNRRLPGEGHIDFPAIAKLLNAKGYDGYVSLEVLNNPSAEHVQEYAGEMIRRVFGDRDSRK